MPNQRTKERIDIILVERGLAQSRERAKALIMAGQVIADEVKIDKPGTKINIEAQIRLLTKDHQYVGRGALKLAGALDHFRIDLKNLTAIDAGASTGGFTQIMLERGAKKVYAIDVGYGILDHRIRTDSRVVPIEKTNVRDMPLELIPEKADFMTIDLSFISLKKVLPNLIHFLKPGAGILALIKPQFEVGKGEVEKGGLVTDPEKHKRVVKEISDFCSKELKLQVIGTVESPIEGTTGNKEFFIYGITSYGL